MTNIPFKIKFDLIYSTFDSVNYLTSRKKLLDLFKQVSELLSPDGVFTFDASLEKNSMTHIKEPLRKGIFNGIHFEQTSEYNKISRVHKNVFMIKDNDGIHTEVHRQKIFPFETYFELMDLAGLYVKRCYNSFSYDEGNADSERVQFILKKVKSNAKL